MSMQIMVRHDSAKVNTIEALAVTGFSKLHSISC